MSGVIDDQIAEGDLVATRWHWRFKPTSWAFKILGRRDPIINVFRFRDGKIVEIWNHRHDIDTGRGNLPFFRGFGSLIAMVGSGVALMLWWKRRKA